MSNTGWIKSFTAANNSIRKPHYNILVTAEAPAAITIISSTTSRSWTMLLHHSNCFLDTAGNRSHPSPRFRRSWQTAEPPAHRRTRTATLWWKFCSRWTLGAPEPGTRPQNPASGREEQEQFPLSHRFVVIIVDTSSSCAKWRNLTNCFLMDPVQLASAINMHNESGFPISHARDKQPPHMQHFPQGHSRTPERTLVPSVCLLLLLKPPN